LLDTDHLNLVTSVPTLETDTYIESKHGIINLNLVVSTTVEVCLSRVTLH